jgi:hypothetical protein
MVEAINELQHQLTQQARKILAADPARYPDAVFFALLHEIGDGHCAPYLQYVYERAFAR